MLLPCTFDIISREKILDKVIPGSGRQSSRRRLGIDCMDLRREWQLVRRMEVIDWPATMSEILACSNARFHVSCSGTHRRLHVISLGKATSNRRYWD